jgi:hypothetical protein
MNIKQALTRATVLAVTAGAAASVVPAQATERAPAVPGERDTLAHAVRLLAPHVTRQADGTFSLDATPKVTAAVGSDLVGTIDASMGRVNDMVRDGELTTDSRLGVHLANGGVLAKGGANGLSFHWWGIEVDLDSYWTKKLLGVISAGAGAAGIAATLAAAGVISSPAALPAGVAAGVLAIGGGVISFCSNDNGVSLYLTYNGIPWCSGQ